MIRGLLRLGVVGLAIGWIADRLIAARRGGDAPEPIRSVIVIDAPIERVWAVVADVEGQPRWMHEMKAVRVLTPGPIGVGTSAEAEIRILGISAVDPVVITTFEPPRRFAIRHVGQFTGDGTIELEPGATGGTTVVTWVETLVAPYLPYLGGVVLRPILGRIFQADLGHLRDLIETPAKAG